MNFRSLAVCLTIGVSCAAGAGQAGFEEAVQHYRMGRWSAAYGQLVVLANNGHRDAARMALFMHQYGPVLYGTPWDASDEDVELWIRTAGSWRKPGEPERVASARPHTARPLRASPFPGRGAQSPGQR